MSAVEAIPNDPAQEQSFSDSQAIALAIAAHADEKKAADILILDMRGLIDYADFFVIVTGNTDRQVKAIHDSVQFGLKHEYALLPRRVEGLPQAQWILMDYLDAVLHIFTPELREFYRLERLWGEARRVPFP